MNGDIGADPSADRRPVFTEVEDHIAAAPLRHLAALLDHSTPPWPDGVLPPLGHWLFFLPEARQSTLGKDGHPAPGADLPPVPAPRRMWAGSRIEFRSDLVLGTTAVRRSGVVKVERKEGRSGALTFVTLRHEISGESGAPAIVELQDLVYRAAALSTQSSIAAGPVVCDRTATYHRTLTTDPVLLFRYSALTFNAHRIHYDLPYARDVEHYPGLVVHGPLQATMLVDHLLRWRPDARLLRFDFRGIRPLIGGSPLTLNLAEREGGVDLWTTDERGQECMRADAVLM